MSDRPTSALPDGDDRLSGYLDGELSAAERSSLEADLARSATLRLELDATREARDAVRRLPEVEPRPGFYEGLLPRAEPEPVPVRRSRRARRLLPAVAAVAAAWFIVLAFGAGTPVTRIVPPLDDYVTRHSQAAAQGAGMGFVEMEDESGVAQGAIGDMEMTARFQKGATVQTVYGEGAHRLSIFRETGEVDFAELPAGTPMMMGDTPAWSGDVGEAHVLVVNRDGVTFTVVGAKDDMGAMDDMDQMLHSDDDASIGDRLRRAAHDVVRTIGFG